MSNVQIPKGEECVRGGGGETGGEGEAKFCNLKTKPALTVRKEIKCGGETEILHKIVHFPFFA